MLQNLLISEEFKKKENEKAQIDITYLKIFGLLHCVGSKQEKAVQLFGILQEGGVEKHTHISASDKDLEDVFRKFCAFATNDLFKLATDHSAVECPFSADDQKKIADQITDFRENVFLEDIYGAESRLTTEAWLAKVVETANYVFSAEKLRVRLCQEA